MYNVVSLPTRCNKCSCFPDKNAGKVKLLIYELRESIEGEGETEIPRKITSRRTCQRKSKINPQALWLCRDKKPLMVLSGPN